MSLVVRTTYNPFVYKGPVVKAEENIFAQAFLTGLNEDILSPWFRPGSAGRIDNQGETAK